MCIKRYVIPQMVGSVKAKGDMCVVEFTEYEKAIERVEDLEEAIHRLRGLEDSYDTEVEVLGEILHELNRLCGT